MNINTSECEIIRENIPKADYSFKLVIIGDSGVGKSCLAIRVVNESFQLKTTSTIGFDFFHFNVKINRSSYVNLKIWDTCGQEKYKSLITSFYDKASLAIIMYSIDSRESFVQISEWVQHLKMHSSPDCKIVLIASKSDLEENRQVSIEEGKQCQSNYGFELFMETSSRTGFNVEELFMQIAVMLFNEQSHKVHYIDPEIVDVVKLKNDSGNADTNKKKCCKPK